jgi:hypothetical protein
LIRCPIQKPRAPRHPHLHNRTAHACLHHTLPLPPSPLPTRPPTLSPWPVSAHPRRCPLARSRLGDVGRPRLGAAGYWHQRLGATAATHEGGHRYLRMRTSAFSYLYTIVGRHLRSPTVCPTGAQPSVVPWCQATTGHLRQPTVPRHHRTTTSGCLPTATTEVTPLYTFVDDLRKKLII